MSSTNSIDTDAEVEGDAICRSTQHRTNRPRTYRKAPLRPVAKHLLPTRESRQRRVKEQMDRVVRSLPKIDSDITDLLKKLAKGK